MLEDTEGATQMDNPEKLTKRRRKTKQKHNTIIYDTTMRKQTQRMEIRHKPSYKILEAKSRSKNQPENIICKHFC